ncbi:Serine/threonine-protein kinase PrkC [Aquisphaera giovannonii]|uniref:Serine/threonine-protein kinase PrkC n=1 Tax=Aquisphaera giovannonii TaxID=406548 RepID=A0A5B9WCG9_9BACT|nr:serine/threonine-protein kinase [Aquisphaera giovannonii]QEH38183.1 Serine/threonine-protein kinase PrkC [Aquisphaera giovannonii]
MPERVPEGEVPDADAAATARAAPPSGDIDPGLAGLFEDLLKRLQGGAEIDVEAVAAGHPAWAAEIRRMAPVLLDLAMLGRGEPAGLPGGRPFGGYRIDREIGRGGMGVVYEAEQLAIGRRVALKVLLTAASLDANALRRFQLEAQVAGLLQHPRIVPVYDVGIAEGVPYYAMQLVDGGSLADLIAAMRGRAGRGGGPDGSDLDALAEGMLSGRFAPSRDGDPARPVAAPGSLRSRSYVRTVARLGIEIAEALAYAHDRGVTHRDIKPANLLLDRRGDVWVVDFGMADVQGEAGLTRTGDLPGTLRYMSPEQALGRRALVDRRADIYALGATLHELLTLRPAVGGADRQEILRRIVEEVPEPIRRANPGVPADLATVVAKAMARDPADRYETAGRLAEDLRRFLDGRPIAARPVGPAARAWRWCRRKPITASLVAALAASLVLGLAAATWGWQRSARQGRLLEASERATRVEAAKLAAVHRFLIDRLLGQASPEINPDGGRSTIREALDRASADVGPAFAGQPEVEAAVRLAIGKAYHGMGDYATAERHLRIAHALFGSRPGDPAPEAMEAEAELGHVLGHLARLDEAEPLLIDATDRSRRRLGPDSRVAMQAAGYLAEFLSLRGRNDEAEDEFRRILAAADAAPDAAPEVVLSARNDLGDLLRGRGRLDEAEATLRRTIDDATRLRGRKHPAALSALNNLAAVLEKRGKVEEAERIFRECLDVNREVLGPDHAGTLTCEYNLAHVLAKRHRDGEAEAAFRRVLDAHRRVFGADHPSSLYVASGLGDFLRTTGRAAEAEPLLRTTLEVQRRILGPEHPATRLTSGRLKSLLDERVTSTPPRSLRP